MGSLMPCPLCTSRPPWHVTAKRHKNLPTPQSTRAKQNSTDFVSKYLSVVISIWGCSRPGKTACQKNSELIKLEVRHCEHNGRWGGRSGVFDINGWLENDRAAILHRFPFISSKTVTENTQTSIFHDFWIWKSHLNTEYLQNAPWWPQLHPN